MRSFIQDHKTIFVGALITASTPLLMALAQFNPDAITNWKSWAVGIGAASVRQVAAYIATQIASE